MSKHFYLMRHGQTRFNEQHRIQGVCDSPLTELGIKQAQQAADYFKDKGIVFEEIYSSTQERACDTAEIVSGRKDIIRLKGLKEWDFGTFEGQQEYLNPPLQAGGVGYGDYFVVHGGESNQVVRERMGETVRDLLENSSAKTILAVSHGGAIAQFFRHILADPPQIRGMHNCAILHFYYDNGEFDLLSIYNPDDASFIYRKGDQR